MLLILLQRSDPGDSLWIWLIVILIPLLGRIAGWVLERLGGRSPQSEDKAPVDRQARSEARRERARELERRGQEMWKRLLEGGEPPPEPPEPTPSAPAQATQAAPAAPRVRPATLVPRTGAARRARGPLPHDELPSEHAVPTLERELGQSLPSDSMPKLPELAQHLRSDLQAERDLRADEGQLETGRVDYLEGLRLRSEARPSAAGVAVGPPENAADWRRAVLWSEVLGSPVSLRDGLERDLPALR